MNESERPGVEVVFSPALLPLYNLTGKTAVVIDILRATSSMCVAFDKGIRSIVPVTHVEEALTYRKSGFKTAGERDGQKLEGFDLGNSPFDFIQQELKGSDLVMTTTNGTKAIQLSSNASKIYIGSFLNLEALLDRLRAEVQPVVAVCAGWKEKFNLEDSLFAGALASGLSEAFSTSDDSAIACMTLWDSVKHMLPEYIKKASHAQRFERLGIEKDIDFCLQQSIYNIVPEVKEGVIRI